jgi:hypothetical protein
MRSCIGWIVRVATAFDRWVREPVDPRPLAWFRSWFGFLTLVNLWMLWPDMPMWLANGGVLPPDIHRQTVYGPALTVYLLTGYADASIWIIRLLALAGGLGLWLGAWPRCAACCVWLAATSYSWRNPSILHSGDCLVRIGAFFLMFARTDGAASLPRWLRRRLRPGASDAWPPPAVPAWPQRILQLQLCILYFVTAVWKSMGGTWRDGTAVGMVLQLGEFQRFPIPDFFMTPLASQLFSYGTLAFEFGFPLLVWVPALRLPVLAAGLAFHAGLEWVLNVQLFQWLITSYYILFLIPSRTAPSDPSQGEA